MCAKIEEFRQNETEKETDRRIDRQIFQEGINDGFVNTDGENEYV